MRRRSFLVLTAFLLFAYTGAGAIEPGLTPEQTLDDDLAGPRVAWLGQISDILAGSDETCFVLNQVQELYGGYAFTATKFVACNPGNFDGAAFLPGKILRVEGNLGPAIRRRIAGRQMDAHLIAAPKLVPQPDLQAYRGSPFYDGYPYRDPFFDPWYPHFGIGFGYHHRRR